MARQSFAQDAAASAPVLAPPAPGAAALPPPAAHDNAAGSALPDVGATPARSPGLELPPEAGLPSGPVGAGAPVQKSQEQIKGEIREDAFNAALTGLMPLEPDEIRRVLKRFDQTKEATETPIYKMPDPLSVVRDVSLDPGAKPVEINVAVGNVTTVSILDSTGAPWPIQDMTWAGNFEVKQPEQGGAVFRITPLSEFAYGNISIRLIDLKTPVTFMLRTHRDTVFYRMDARMPGRGPNAKPPLIVGGITIAAGDETMTSVLDGDIPSEAVKMLVNGTDGRTTAYKVDDSVYVRTPLTLLSPAWQASTKSADGTNVYMLDDAPVILLSDQGKMVRARLSEKEDQK